MMENEERKRYAEAIQRAGIARGFDRILNILVVIIFIGVAAFVVYQQSVYQTGSRVITSERDKQLMKLEEEIQGNRRFTACLKALPAAPPQPDIDACYKTAGVQKN